MTLMEAINEADRLKPNAYSTEDKLRWLERLDRRIWREILQTHEGEAGSFPSYGPGDAQASLLAQPPYDEMAVHWLCAQIDYYNGELDSFNASNAMFEALYDRCRCAFHRQHKPRSGEKHYG